MKIRYVIEAVLIGLFVLFVGWLGGLDIERGIPQACFLAVAVVLSAAYLDIRSAE